MQEKKILDDMPALLVNILVLMNCCEFTIVFTYTKRLFQWDFRSNAVIWPSLCLSYFLFPHPASTLFDENVPPVCIKNLPFLDQMAPYCETVLIHPLLPVS